MKLRMVVVVAVEVDVDTTNFIACSSVIKDELKSANLLKKISIDILTKG